MFHQDHHSVHFLAPLFVAARIALPRPLEVDTAGELMIYSKWPVVDGHGEKRAKRESAGSSALRRKDTERRRVRS